MIYPHPAGQAPRCNSRPCNFINGQWTPPVKGEYFDNITPINGQAYCQAARSTAEDIERALDAAHAAADAWARLPPPSAAASC